MYAAVNETKKLNLESREGLKCYNTSYLI